MEKAYSGSTDDILIGSFRPHGRVDIRIVDPITYSEAYGPFNAELIHALIRVQRKLAVQATLQGPQGEIISIYDSALAGPEVIGIFTRALEAMLREGRSKVGAALLIGPDVEGITIMLPAILACYTKAGIPNRVFEKMEDAEIWIKGLIEAARVRADAGAVSG
ncbi:hypothetical protein [Undibacterium sp.]|uniref:hypothetical protein n=1 Tax=Undibacterium sp. TaxID=1914977 RepID=UPI00374D2F8D